jgi:hypothetical protein
MTRNRLKYTGPVTASDGFVFDVKSKRVHNGEHRLLKSLAECSKALGNRGFSMDEFDTWGHGAAKAQTISRRLRGWRRAQWLAGVGRAPNQNYTADELMETLEKFWRDLGRPPGKKSLLELGSTGLEPYRKRWGSLADACERLAAFHAGKISRAELLKHSNPRRRRSPLSVSARWRVLMRDGFRCKGCGRSGHDAGVKLEVDHIKPVSRGGSDSLRNLRTLCFECNRGKGAIAA